MFVRTIVADAFATNCYVVAPTEGRECVVIDPGIGVVERVRKLLAEEGLTLAAVLLTHGHLDHTFAATPLSGAGTAPVPAYIHPGDRYRLADPVGSIGPQLGALVEQELGNLDRTEPHLVRELTHGQTLTVAGLELEVTHTPGHTEGSVLLTAAGLPDGIPADDVDRTTFTGDVLFAGSIGRTDLPGGDHATMQRSLQERVLALPDTTLVLPGHGPGTTMDRERGSNPFLQGPPR